MAEQSGSETRLGWFRTADGHAHRLSWGRYWRGRWRLLLGFCPLCNSSPPRRICPICQGSYVYGRKHLSDRRKAKWRARLDALRQEA